MEKAQWYVVHTYSGYENKVKDDIEKTIANRKLQDQILKVSVPLEAVEVIKNGQSKISLKKMLPGYVLLHMIMNEDTWYVVRNTRGVTGFVGPGSKAVPLSPEEVRALGFDIPKDELENNPKEVIVDFEVGDIVTVITGAWAGKKGTIQSIHLLEKTVTILLESFVEREIPVEVGFTEIMKQ